MSPKHWRRDRSRFGGLLAIAAVLVLSCGTAPPSSGRTTGTTSSGPIVVDVFDLGTAAPGKTDQSQIFAAANRIIKHKIGTTADFNVISSADMPTKTQTQLASGTPVDLMFAADWLGGPGYSDAAERGAYRPLNRLLHQYGKGILAAEPNYMIQSAAIRGKIYGIGPLQNYTLDPGWDVEKRVLTAAGVTTQPKGGILYLSGADRFGMDNISKIMAAAKPKLKGTSSSFTMLGYMEGGAPTNPGGDFVPMTYGLWPTNSSAHTYEPFYVPMGSTKVTLGLPQLRSYANTMRQWYQDGYMPRDIGTNGNPPVQTQADYGANFNWTGGGDLTHSNAPTAGLPNDTEFISIPLEPRPYFLGYNGGWSLPSSGQHPVAAMKLLNLLFTDSKLINLLSYGIEGRDYTVQNDSIVPTKSASYVESCWIWGNCFITPAWPYSAGSPADGPNFWKLTDQWAKSSVVSPLAGFHFNSQAVSDAWDQVQAASQRYWLQLFTGSVNVNQVWPQFVAALKAAGADQVMRAMQSQINSYLKAHPSDRAALLHETYQRLISAAPQTVND